MICTQISYYVQVRHYGQRFQTPRPVFTYPWAGRAIAFAIPS